MLKLDLIQRTQDFFSAYAGSVNDNMITVVSPNPQIADLARKRFDSVGKQVDSITISKFIKDELNALFEPEELAGFRGKSELILLLGAIWKKIGGDNSFIAFQRAFGLLTEFRSFSVSEQVLETVLENYDQSISEQVLWLQRFMGELDLIDEHRSYYMLSEKLRAGDLPSDYAIDRKIIFYGFDYLTALQVDLIKSLSLRSDINIPFYQAAYDKASGLDWIKWFADFECEVNSIKSQAKKICEIKGFYFSKNYLGKEIKSITTLENDFDIVMATKNMTREFLQEIPINDLKYKVPVDLFGAEFNYIAHQIEQIVEEEEISTDELRELLKNHISKLTEQERFREIKVITVLLRKIEEWETLSSENTSVGSFDFQILKESSILDLPRISLTGFNAKSSIGAYNITDIEKIKNRKVYLCLNSNYGPLQGGGATHSENVEKYLASIGPIRRIELELEVLKCKLREFISDNDVSIIAERNLIDHDTVLNKIFSDFVIDIQENKSVLFKEKSYEPISKKNLLLNSLSASKLQKYIECPRKFYHQYISKFNPNVVLKSEIPAMELGQIQHKVIEEFFKQNLILSELILEKLIHEISRPYFSKKNIEREADYLVEIKAYTYTCIEWLINLRENIPEIKLNFEYPLKLEKQVQILGSVDLFAQFDGVTLLIDFKRSNSIFKTFTAIEEFKQIQLWFYLTKLMDMNAIKTSDIITGYIDLSNIENSVFFTSSKDLAKNYKSLLSPAKVKAIDNFDDSVNSYTELEDEYIAKMLADEDFLPKPRDKDSCLYCAVSSICSRGLDGNA